MNGSGLALAGMAVLVTAGEQVRLARRERPFPVLAVGAAYGASAWAATGALAAAGGLALLCAAGCGAAEWAWRRRGPGVWTALAVLLAPYVSLWWTWAAFQPGIRPILASALGAAAARLAIGAARGPDLAAHALAVAAAYVFCWGGGTFLTRSVLGGYGGRAAVVTRRPDALLEVAAAGDPAEQGLLRAGRLIGELERFLTLSLALTGDYTAIGFVIAAKSIARFDLARRHGEYFLVGTLCSVGTALAVGILVRRLLQP